MSDPYLSLYAVDRVIERCLDAGEIDEIPALAKARMALIEKIRDPDPDAAGILQKTIACEERCREKAERKRNEIGKALAEGRNVSARVRAYCIQLKNRSVREVSHDIA
ncbi:MAG: flagellar protein FliT [Deltaproteobacteria bacterium]